MIPCDFFRGNSLVLGLGSPLRGDDQAGLLFCDLLSQRGVNCVKCDYGLENCVDIIIEKKPEKIVIVDVALFNGGRPGDIVLINGAEALSDSHLLTTHSIPPRLLIDTVKKLIPLREVYIIGIYPKSLDFSVDVSSEVIRAINSLVENIVKCFNNA